MRKITYLALSILATPLFAAIQLSPLPLEKIGKVVQFTLTEQGEIVAVNQKGELWRENSMQALAKNISTKISPLARYNRIAAADKQGNFFLWTPEKSYTSTIPLAENARMESLALATIAVSKQAGHYKLVRIETQGAQTNITAISESEVLPDARPLQVYFEGEDQQQGHIAVLAKPDSSTYQHGVLGDDIEATEIQFLERHSLRPLAESLTVKGLVFEANQFSTLTENRKSSLVSVLSGNGEGGRTVLIEPQNGKLQIKAESEPLPNYRWQSPFVFNQKLYSVQMPHLVGRLVEYHLKGAKLENITIGSGLSNHIYGEHETNLAASTNEFALIPQRDYRSVAVLNKLGKLEKLPTILPSTIRQTQSSSDKIYLLLENGEIWVADNK